MATPANHHRWIPPAALTVALALAGAAGRGGDTQAAIRPVRVDPGSGAGPELRSLEGLGDEAARSIVAARRLLAIDSPAALATVPGVGSRLVHRWHADLAFRGRRP